MNTLGHSPTPYRAGELPIFADMDTLMVAGRQAGPGPNQPPPALMMEESARAQRVKSILHFTEWWRMQLVARGLLEHVVYAAPLKWTKCCGLTFTKGLITMEPS